ncbi:MAG: CHAT domain-containing protein, partial [Candidatus Rokubacteria bacterium]|nr:CHAT domain-containing protein [Candidatus Rokubacteria bacterium]
AFTLNSLGSLLWQTGDYAAARPLYERALQIREQALGPNHPLVAVTLNSLGLLSRQTGDYAAARPLYERALRIREQALGPTHALVAMSLNDFAELLRFTGDYAAARPLYERALQIREQAFGPNHPAVAMTVNSLAELLRVSGNYAAARPLYERALNIREQALGPTHPSVAFTLTGFGFLLQATGDHAAARPLYERALQIHEQALGPQHPAVAVARNHLAFLLYTAGDHAAAKPLFEKSLRIARTASVPEARWRAALGLAGILEREGRLAEALQLYQEAVRTLEGLAGQFGEEESRAQYLQAENRLRAYDALARLLLKLHEKDSDKGYDREAWAVLEAKKGRVVAEAMAALRPELKDPQARAEAKKAQIKKDRILALERELHEEEGKPPQDQRPEKVQSLTALLAQTKAEYLVQVQRFLARYPQYKARFVDQQTVDPRALAKFADRLPAGTLVVQYFAAPDTLYVFVVARGQQFRVKSQAVSQADLYASIKLYRQFMERAVTQRLRWADDGSEVYRQEVAPLKELTRKLAAHLLAPIEAELQAHGNLILVPNDLLLYLPIHALTRKQPDGSVRFLVETHKVSYLTQLELVDLLNPGKPMPDAPLLAVANPDGSLPGASQEVRALRRMRSSVTALEGAQATKARFLSLVSQFPEIHLATHGVLDPQRPELTYLLMAGPDEASQRLGIGEIAGLSLSPNGLAILSACETAVGEQLPGAALMTLAAAFSQAGVQSVVASLWKVEDKATRDFMVAFHRALSTHGRASALQQAQLAVLKEPLTAHPYYWAPLILIGAR